MAQVTQELDGGRLEQVRDPVRIMGEVRVHGYRELRALAQGGFEPGDVGCSEAQLCRPVYDLEAGLSGRHLVQELAGPVGGIVIDDYHLPFDSGKRRFDAMEQFQDIGRFIIGRNDDQRFHWSFPRTPAADDAMRTPTAAPRVNTDIQSPRLSVDASYRNTTSWLPAASATARST